MNTVHLSATAAQLIDGFDTHAHKAIGLWREGGDRLGELARARWDHAFAQSKPKLSPETQHNATRAQQAFAGYYARGVSLSASGAKVAVGSVVQAARVAVERAAAWQQSRA